MRHNIIYIILLMIISIFTNLTHASLSIKPNIEGGNYNNAIEINLLSNDKKAKIFYYTDGEGRLDNQKEYNGKPILIKKSTNLNYYAFKDTKNSTLIEETKYILKYPNNFSVNYNNGYIEIKNKNNKTVNISYWKIEANNINYEIYKNIFLKKGELYKLDYIATESEKISFISPDNKVKLNYQIPKTIKKEKIDLKQKDTSIDSKKEVTFIEQEIKIKSEKIINKDNTSLQLSHNQILNFDSKEKKVKGGFDINKHLKTSITDTKTYNKNILYILVFIFSLGIIFKVLFYMNNIGLIHIKILDKFKKID